MNSPPRRACRSRVPRHRAQGAEGRARGAAGEGDGGEPPPRHLHRQKYQPRLQFLDLIQEGNIGLMKAVDRFDAPRLQVLHLRHLVDCQAITRSIADQAPHHPSVT